MLLGFALLGFLLGSTAYVIFDTFLLKSLAPIPIMEILSAPWFLSGIAGSALSTVAIYASAHFSGDE